MRVDDLIEQLLKLTDNKPEGYHIRFWVGNQQISLDDINKFNSNIDFNILLK